MSLELILCGDEVVDCKTHVGYLHRGFEKLMERRTFIQNFPIVCRIAVPEPTFNEYLYAAAVEELTGIQSPERAEWLRTLNLELMRLASYLMWLGGIGASFGQGTVYQWTVTHRDYVLDLFEEMTGARVYHMYIVPGGVRARLPEGFEERARRCPGRCRETARRSREGAVQERGVQDPQPRGWASSARRWWTTTVSSALTPEPPVSIGICAGTSPIWSTISSNFDVITGTASDAYERALVRHQEMYQGIRMMRQILDRMPY